MNNKEELKKQVIILSLVLVFVIIVAIVLNTRNSKNTNDNIQSRNTKTEATSNSISNNLTQEEKMKANLKGLLQESDDEEYIQEEIEGTNETIYTTKSGETIIVRE